MAKRILKVAFLDIGNTLGDVDAQYRLTPYPTTRPMLATMRDVLGLRLGVVTNVPDGWVAENVRALLHAAGLDDYFELNGLITSTAAGAAKPAAQIYHFAAAALGVDPAECLYIGETPAEVRGAATAGMTAITKPAPAS